MWPRDLVETAFGFSRGGRESRCVPACWGYLEATQEDDGHWPQNMWLDGRPYWNGLQMDEAAFPILLVDLLRRALCPRRRWPILQRWCEDEISPCIAWPLDLSCATVR